MAKIPFVGYGPDLPIDTQGVIVDCANVVPYANGFRGAPTMVNALYPALEAQCIGAATVKKLDGTYRAFAGTTTKLFEATSGTWTNQSRTTPAYNGTTDVRWRFAQFGNSTLAVQKNDVIQKSTSTTFADISGSPKASLIETVGMFVMVADTNEGTYGDSPDRWWCCGQYDETTWTPSSTTQATTGRLVDAPGKITALRALGSNIVAYKDRAMYVGQYVGSPSVWQFRRVPGEIGTYGNECVVNVDGYHLFCGSDNFYRFDGSRVTPIGTPIWKWFYKKLNKTEAWRIQTVIDINNTLVYWVFPTNSTTLDTCVVYNYRTGQWGRADMTIESVMEVIVGLITYATIGNLYSTYDDLPNVSYDSPFWSAASKVVAVFDGNHTLQQLTGVCGNSTITTQAFGQDTPTTTLTRVRPSFRLAPTTATAKNYYRMTLDELGTEDSTSTINRGRFDFIRAAPWHQIKMDFTGDYEITGFSPELVEESEE